MTATRTRHIETSAHLSDLEACTTFAELRALVDRWEAEVPQEHRDAATIQVVNDRDDGWGLSVTYSRPETEEDRRRDAERRAERLARVEAYERANYERLKKKFEGGAT